MACVYVIQAEGLSRCKVGIAINPKKRLESLQFASPVRLILVAAFEARQPRVIEREVHQRLAGKRLWGEWFDMSPAEAIAIVQTVAAAKRQTLEQWQEPPLLETLWVLGSSKRPDRERMARAIRDVYRGVEQSMKNGGKEQIPNSP
jgi:hypothetical protein